MKKLNKFFYVIILMLLSNSLFAQSSSVKLTDFDEAVRSSRVEIRKYCALVQQLMNENDEAKKNEALAHLTNSINLWSDVNKFSDNVPEEYSGDKNFSGKLNELHNKLEEMKSKLVEDQFKESFDACGAACGLFVKLHEENNLDYALDKLFHLRKAVKKMQGDLTANDESIIENDIKSILQKRNDVVAVDMKLNPGLADNEEYRKYIREASDLTDEIAFIYFNKKEIQLENKLVDLFAVINKAYSLAL
jgi:hypothetical protein